MTEQQAVDSCLAASRTRAELLDLQAARVDALEQQLLSFPRHLAVAGWMLLAGIGSAMVGSAAPPQSSVSGVLTFGVGLVLLVGAAVLIVRHVRRDHALRSELRLWENVDRTAHSRSLPDGTVDPSRRTIHDARDDPDFLEHVRELALRHQLHVRDLRLVYPSMPLILTGVIGLVGLLVGLVPDSVGERIGGLGMAVTMLLPSTVVVVSHWTVAWHRQLTFNRVGIERQLYTARRALLTGEQPPVDPSVPLVAKLALGLLALCIAAYLAIRISLSSPLALILTLVILVVAAAVVAVALLLRRRIRVIPLLAAHGADSHALAGSPRRVTLELQEDRLQIQPVEAGIESQQVSTAEILSVESVDLGYPFAPPAVGLVTRGAPIVLAGRNIADHPAVRALDDATRARSAAP